jgi:hypothetical protein
MLESLARVIVRTAESPLNAATAQESSGLPRLSV